MFWIKKNTTEERFSFYCRKFEILHSSWIFCLVLAVLLLNGRTTTHLMSFLGCARGCGQPSYFVLLLFWFGKKGRGKQVNCGHCLRLKKRNKAPFPYLFFCTVALFDFLFVKTHSFNLWLFLFFFIYITIAEVFYNVKKLSTVITSKNSSKNLSNENRLAF